MRLAILPGILRAPYFIFLGYKIAYTYPLSRFRVKK